MIVVDASVAVKWYRPDEAGSEQALDILTSGQRLVAPSIIQIEVAAALTRLVREKKLATDGARKMISQWGQAILSQVISLENTGLDFERATDLSLTLVHPLQDCLYLAVAMRLEAILVTADKKLLKKAAEVGHASEAV